MMKKNIIYIASLLLFAFVSCSGGTSTTSSKAEVKAETKKENQPTKIILDLDTGIDDAMALAYTLANPEVELIGVVASYGNVTVDESVSNTLALLDMLNHKEVPVYRGADRSENADKTFSVPHHIRLIHGDNGVGNVDIARSSRVAEKQNGVDFMIESANKYGKDLMIVAVGPMTNLNEANKKEPKLKDLIGKIVIMGGALIVDGNVSHCAEANIFNDPIAANELFRSETPVTMVGLDVTLRTQLTRKDTQRWRDLGTTSGKFFADMVDFYIAINQKNSPDLKGCTLHDPLAVGVAIDPSLVKVLKLHMRVGTEKEDWGKTIGLKERMSDPNPNISVCIDVDVDRFVTRFADSLTQLFKEN